MSMMRQKSSMHFSHGDGKCMIGKGKEHMEF
jgi:hypothetical protein